MEDVKLMTKAKEFPARIAASRERNMDTVNAIVAMFNEIYDEIDYIENVLPHLSDRVGVVREKMRRINEYRNNLLLKDGNGR